VARTQINKNTNIDVFAANQKEDKLIGNSGKPKKPMGLNHPPKKSKTVIKDISMI